MTCLLDLLVVDCIYTVMTVTEEDGGDIMDIRDYFWYIINVCIIYYRQDAMYVHVGIHIHVQ